MEDSIKFGDDIAELSKQFLRDNETEEKVNTFGFYRGITIMEELLFCRQFLFSRHKCDALGWSETRVGEYHLYVHPKLERTSVSSEGVELFLLGYFFDHQTPEKSNSDLLEELLKCESFELVTKSVAEYSGQFVLIYKSVETLQLMHDACGQREVFYDLTFSTFGSQPKIIEKVVVGEEYEDQHAREFYQSNLFLKEKIFVGDRTHRSNIKRLAPNHYADIGKKSIQRVFPKAFNENVSVQTVAGQAFSMVRGYLRAASLRYPLDVGVTAGYDSRILFLASMDVSCTHYVGKTEGAKNAIDVDIALKLGKVHHKPVQVHDKKASNSDEWAREIQDLSIDFPRYRPIGRKQSGKMVVNGNVSEIARNYFGYAENLTGAELARMVGYTGSQYVEGIYDLWLQSNKPLFELTGYNYLDMFYWEERMGNWAAKGKTEAGFSVEVYSPFCSLTLLKLLLSTDRKSRDKQFNRLYDAMIEEMSPVAIRIPINPTRKTRVIKLMKRIGIYNSYRKYGIRFGVLKN